MVVKTETNAIPKAYLINAGVTVFFIATAALLVRSSFSFTAEPTCGEIYQSRSDFALRSDDGQRLSPIELQTMTHGQDWGLFENLEIRTLSHETVDVAMKVALPATERGRDAGEKTSGMGFTWRPDFIEGRRSGCLSYHVYIPKSFTHKASGVLPGLHISRAVSDGEQSASDDNRDVSLPVRWYRKNKIGVQLKQVGSRRRPTEALAEMNSDALTPGRWTRIDQQVVVNSPGQANGMIRLWVDGVLRLDAKNVKIARGKGQATLSGVDANVHYTDSSGNWQPAPEPTSIALSKFELMR